MTDPRRQRFAPYFRLVADMLGLKDWRVEVKDEPPMDVDSVATVNLVYGRKYASVRLGEAHLDDTPDEQRNTVLHELIHAHYEAATAIAFANLPDAIKGEYRRHMEYATDGISTAIAPFFPLPPEPESESRPMPTPKAAPAKASEGK